MSNDKDIEGAEFDKSAAPPCGQLVKPLATAATNAPNDSNRLMETFHRFVDAALPNLHRSELATWLILWRLAGEDGIEITSWQIAHRAGCDGRAVQRALRSLRKAGLVQQVRKGGPGRGVSVYRVLRPQAPITWQYFQFDYTVARQRHPWAVPEVLREKEWVPLIDADCFNREAGTLNKEGIELVDRFHREARGIEQDEIEFMTRYLADKKAKALQCLLRLLVAKTTLPPDSPK